MDEGGESRVGPLRRQSGSQAEETEAEGELSYLRGARRYEIREEVSQGL